MPITPNSIAPPRPFSSAGMGESSRFSVQMYVADNQAAIVPGDILLNSSGKVQKGVENNMPADPTTFVGMAITGANATTTATVEDTVIVAPFFPGTQFEFSFTATVAAGGSDATPTSTLGGLMVNAGHEVDFVSTVTSFVVMHDAAGGDMIAVGFAPQQMRGQNINITAGTPVNPRVIAIPKDSVFHV